MGAFVSLEQKLKISTFLTKRHTLISVYCCMHLQDIALLELKTTENDGQNMEETTSTFSFCSCQHFYIILLYKIKTTILIIIIIIKF